MMRAKDELLARVRAALVDVPGLETPADVPVSRAHRQGGAPDLDQFVDRLVDYKAAVRRTAAAGVAAAVAAALQERAAGRVVVPAGFPAAWLADTGSVEVVGDEPPLPATALDELDGVVTTCAVAIAETGTLILDGGDGMGRRALTLVPDYHLCVVPADRVVATVGQALARLDPVRPLTWVSGPSATSDIELSRVEGVHGPRTLEVILVD
jgi:L-lactate dehydrogenase complex protein LldG